MSINRTTFFAYVRRAPFANKLAPRQVEGMTAILDVWDAHQPSGDPRWLAYILATAFHETGSRMVPVREGFAASDAAARKVVARRPYGQPDATTGEVYYGRGHVQLTWAKNYKSMGTILGRKLYASPDLALDLKVSAEILVEGMTRGASAGGDFTGKGVESYFNGTTEDAVGARAVVNGTDKAALIAGYYESFKDALVTADEATPQPHDVDPVAALPDTPNLSTDKTLWGSITGLIGASGLGFLGSIDNPWALLALVVVGLGVVLFLTGRLEIRHKAGV